MLDKKLCREVNRSYRGWRRKRGCCRLEVGDLFPALEYAAGICRGNGRWRWEF